MRVLILEPRQVGMVLNPLRSDSTSGSRVGPTVGLAVGDCPGLRHSVSTASCNGVKGQGPQLWATACPVSCGEGAENADVAE